MKVGKIKSLLMAIFGCFYAVFAYSATSLFSDYGQIQNVQNYSTNPFWTPNSPYNQKMPQPVYVQGTAISNEECVKVLQSAVSMQCMARDNCKNTSLSDIRPAVIVQLSNLPNKAYSTACIGYLDTVYESYVAQYGNNAPTGRVNFPNATTPNPSLNNNAPVIQNPYEIKTPKWQQEINERSQELQRLQSQTNSVNTGLTATAFPTTYADLSFSERMANDTEGYAPYKGTTAYKTINVTYNTAEWCSNHAGAPECKQYEEEKRKAEQAKRAANTTNTSAGKSSNAATGTNNTSGSKEPFFNGSTRFINECISKFATDKTKWQDALFNKDTGVFKDIADNAKLTQDVIDLHEADIYNLLVANVREYCLGNIGAIAKNGGTGTIQFEHNKQIFSFNFTVEKLFKYFPMRVAMLILKDSTKKPNDIIKKSELPTNYWWNKYCSDHIIWSNSDDDAAINQAGQAAFTEFGGAEHEYFIDFPVGKSCRAFPGLILQDITGSTVEGIIVYNNIQLGLQRLIEFTNALKGRQCSKDGLSAYLVAIDATIPTESTHIFGDVTAGLGAGTATAGGITIAVAGLSNPVGWVLLGTGAVAAGLGSLIPTDIADIQQVAVIDGPYLIE